MIVLLTWMMVGASEVEINKADLKLLQGTWQLHSQEHGGKKSPMKEVASITLEVKEAQFTVRDGLEVKEDAAVQVLRSKSKPASIDIKITAGPDLDKIIKGIWKLERDNLIICLAEPGKERPKEFAGKEGTGHTLLGFTRAKPK